MNNHRETDMNSNLMDCRFHIIDLLLAYLDLVIVVYLNKNDFVVLSLCVIRYLTQLMHGSLIHLKSIWKDTFLICKF